MVKFKLKVGIYMLDTEVNGVVIKVMKQWWLKINKKPIRISGLDKAEFPYIIKVKYFAGDKMYFKYKWINPGKDVPQINDSVTVLYDELKPRRAKVILDEDDY